MNQVFANKPVAYRIAIGASVTLGVSWLSYLGYLSITEITKQSVYMGPITFYAALLLAVSGLSATSLLCSVGYLAHIRNRLAKRAAIWGLGSIFVVVVIFSITRPLINGAT